MGREIVGNCPAEVQVDNSLTVNRFRESLWQTVRLLAIEEGVNFDNLPIQGQLQREIKFLQRIWDRLSREQVLSLELEAASPSDEEKEINRETVELTVSCQDEEISIRLGEDRKKMLASFTLLTEKKIQRGLVPWITRKELTKYVCPTYSLAQLDSHLFDPLAESGLLEVSYHKGYRLAARPADVWEVLQGEESHYFLKAEGFKSWVESQNTPLILVEEYQLPLIRAISQQCSGHLAEEFLRLPALCASVGLSKDRVYESLKKLEELGLIRRATSVSRYRVGDVNIEYVIQLLRVQEEEIVLRVRFKEKTPWNNVGSFKHDIQAGRARPLDVQGQEEFDFPAVSWREKKVEVEGLDFEDEHLLKKTYQVLIADFQPVEIVGQGRIIFSGNLPSANDLDQKTILATLEFLGFGPEELERCKVSPTLAAAVRQLEQSEKLIEQLLVQEVKSRLLSLFFGEIVLPEEGKNYAWNDLMKFLEEGAKLIKVVQGIALSPNETIEPETPVLQTEEVIFEAPLEAKTTPFLVNSKLLQLMEPFIKKEIISATNQPSVFNDWLPPTAAYNYHRILSIKADFIPWKLLEGAGLVNYGDSNRDYHPRISPGGALLTALFFNLAIHNRVMVVGKGEKRAMRLAATHLAHWLSVHLSGNQVLSEKERSYLENCLQNFRNADLLCDCEECQLE